MQSLGLDIKVLDKENNEIDLKQTFDDDEDMGFTSAMSDVPEFQEETVADSFEGFGLEDENGEAIVEDAGDEDYGFGDEE